MSDERFDIVFRGDILPGHQLVEVKARLKQLFKADDARINALFSGGVMPLKRNLEKVAAEKYRSVLSGAGADVQVAPAGTVQSRQAPARAKPSARTDASVSAAPVKPITMQERIEAQEAERLKAVAADEALAAEPEQEGWSLAARGSDLLSADERATAVVDVVDVDVSAFSLRAQEGGLLYESEKTKVEPVSVDVSGLVLDELGADLLDEGDKVGVTVLEIDTSAIDLAPAGSDLGQIIDEKPKLSPDISGISLSD